MSWSFPCFSQIVTRGSFHFISLPIIYFFILNEFFSKKVADENFNDVSLIKIIFLDGIVF